jgi:predicted MFS family arabinose efflux permease
MDMQTNAGASAPAAPPARAWLAVGSIAIGAFALVTAEFLPVGLLPQIARDLGITEGQAGLMVTTPGFIAALAALGVTSLAGTLDRRKVLVGLVALLVVSNIIVATASGLIALVVGRALLGVAVGGFWTIGGSLGPRLVGHARGAKATSLIFSGVSLGTVAGVPAGALLGSAVGWRASFLAAAAISLIVLTALLCSLPQLRPEQQSGLRALPGTVRIRNIRIGLVAIALIFVAQFASYTYITPFLHDVTDISIAQISGVLLAYGLAGFVGNLVGGWAASRNSRSALVGTAALMGASIVGLLVLGTNAPAAIAMVVAWGLAFGMLPIVMQTWMFSAAPDRLESVASVFVSSAQLFIGVGALVGGLLVDHLSVSSALAAGAAFALATAVLTYRLTAGDRIAVRTPAPQAR